jgi:hypothetical protein
VGADVFVAVPGLGIAEVDLDHADAALDEAAGEEAAAAEFGVAVTGASGFRFARDVEGFGRFHLHAEGDLHGFNAGGEFGLTRRAAEIELVEAVHQLQLALLFGGVEGLVADVEQQLVDGGFVVGDVSALVMLGRKPELHRRGPMTG